VNIIALRRRLPLIVVILVAIVCLLALGVACACFTDHQGQAVERALAAVPTSTAPGFVWPVIVISLLGMATLLMVGRRDFAAARSPADLQRFLF
jgi:hypothetical protein